MIIYLDRQELKEFLDLGEPTREGTSYEWESEGVAHLHLHPLSHSFGKVGKVFFSAGEVKTNVDADYFVGVSLSSDGKAVARVLALNNDGVYAEVEPCYIPSSEDLYSRSQGLLEVDILAKKRVMIVGLGSFGSQIAIELAKAGVGHFSLFDFDRLEPHNLARHTGTVKDLGRLKTDVIKESIFGKNPYAEVNLFPININEQVDLMEEEVKKADLVLVCTDNNPSRFHLQEALVKYQRVGIFGRAVTRAEGGDVFRYRPGGPCYCCLIGNKFFDQSDEEITNAASARRNGQIAAYVSEEDANAMVQVGLSADIEPICNMMVKLALVELSRGFESGIRQLEDELVYDYYLWANRRERRHKNYAPLPQAEGKPTILRWYGAHIPKNEECCLCGSKQVLDEGEGLLDEIDDLLLDTDPSSKSSSDKPKITINWSITTETPQKHDLKKDLFYLYLLKYLFFSSHTTPRCTQEASRAIRLRPWCPSEILE